MVTPELLIRKPTAVVPPRPPRLAMVKADGHSGPAASIASTTIIFIGAIRVWHLPANSLPSNATNSEFIILVPGYYSLGPIPRTASVSTGTERSGAQMAYCAYDRSVPVANARGSGCQEAAVGHRYGMWRCQVTPHPV